MGRVYLILIIVGGILASMLPSGNGVQSSSRGTFERNSGLNGSSATALEASHRARFDGGGSVAPSMEVSGQGVTLIRSADGHFYAEAQVNGTPIQFLIDTGASGVALSLDDARRAGLQFFSGEFESVGSGASGEVRGKLVTLDRVTLGGKSVDNVSGAILEGGEMSLLGQSFLARMGTIEISGDRMVIR